LELEPVVLGLMYQVMLEVRQFLREQQETAEAGEVMIKQSHQVVVDAEEEVPKTETKGVPGAIKDMAVVQGMMEDMVVHGLALAAVVWVVVVTAPVQVVPVVVDQVCLILLQDLQ
jgi:hypothetical protein